MYDKDGFRLDMPETRITCLSCKFLSQDKRQICLVAEKRAIVLKEKGKIDGKFPVGRYRPELNTRRRCEFYKKR